MGFAAIVSVAFVITAIYLIVRGWDVRLVLLVAAILISLVAGLNAGEAARFHALALVFLMCLEMASTPNKLKEIIFQFK